MRKKIKNELKEMVANVDWANGGPDSDNNLTMSSHPQTETEPFALAVAKAVLTCRENSHPFEERTLLLAEPVKIGRSVAKFKAMPDNAIFDCKVLSRFHATLWFENGRFYLMDTKSSNGTFVNNQRIFDNSKEVCSGDIVQFGVDVIENSCRVTHGCIMAMLRLFLPDGREAKASSSCELKSRSYIDELSVLNSYLQDAVQREQMLEAKLNSLQQVVENCRRAVASSWKALVCEEHLLSRVQYLETQLAAATANAPPTQLQHVLQDKHAYEVKSTETLRAVHEERLKLSSQLGALQLTACSAQDECNFLRTYAERTHQDVQVLGGRNELLEQRLKESIEELAATHHQLEQEKQKVADLTQQPDNRLPRHKAAENSENGFKEEPLDNDRSDWITNERKLADREKLALVYAIQNLPGYVQALLPEEMLKIAGCRSKTWDSIKDQRKKMKDLQKQLFVLEKTSSESEETNKEESDTYYSNKENLEAGDVRTQVDEECNQLDRTLEEEEPANQNNASNCSLGVANSDVALQDFSDSLIPENVVSEDDVKKQILKAQIKKISDDIKTTQAIDNGQTVLYLHDELAEAFDKIADLSKELEAAKAGQANSTFDICQLTLAKERLSYDILSLENQLTAREEECKALEARVSGEGSEKSDDESDRKYKEEGDLLQSRLERAVQSEADSIRETERLTALAEGLQKQIDEGPSADQIVKLLAQVESLEEQLAERERRAAELIRQVEALTDIQSILEEKISQANRSSGDDEHKQLKPSDDESPSEASVSSEDICESPPRPVDGHILISSSMAAADLMWNGERGKSPAADSSFGSVSVDLQKMSQLEEELIATKEKWAHVNLDRSHLASELRTMTEKCDRLAKRSYLDALIYIVPLTAVLFYVLMYHYVS